MTIIHVAAMSENRVIGKNGQMPWHIPGEQKIFRDLTVGKALILGRKTHESIGRVLPGRTTIVVSRRENYTVPGAHTAKSVEDAIRLAESLGHDEIVIGGGGELFSQTLPYTDTVYLSVVHAAFDGETLYPEIPQGEFKTVSSKRIEASIPYTFTELVRIKPAVRP